MPTSLSKQEAAARLGVSVKTIERHLTAGKLRRELVHTAAGPRVRVLFDDPPPVVDATFAVAEETPVPTPTPLRQGIVQPVAPAPPVATEKAELVAAMFRALDEKQREVEGWARRYGRLEAEVASLRRPWWRNVWEKVRRRP